MNDPKKPSKNEEEYFAKLDAELLSKTREHEIAVRDEAERRSHYMKCPKTGHDLVSRTFQGVQLDTCPVCGGLWLDMGELEALLQHHEPGMFGKILNDVAAAMRRGLKGSA